MWRSPEQVGRAAVRRRVSNVLLAFVTVTAFAAIDVMSSKEFIILGTFVAGPGIAAGAGRPRAVIAVGAYALALLNVLAWWPDEIWGSRRHVVFNVAVLAITGLGVGIATQIRTIETTGALAEKHWRTLAAVVEHSEDAIVATDLRGRLTAFNAGAERLYGYPASEMVGTPVSVFVALATPSDAPGPPTAEIMPGSPQGRAASPSTRCDYTGRDRQGRLDGRLPGPGRARRHRRGVVGDPGHQRPAARRGAGPSGAADGEPRATGRRCRARLQQHPGIIANYTDSPRRPHRPRGAGRTSPRPQRPANGPST